MERRGWRQWVAVGLVAGWAAGLWAGEAPTTVELWPGPAPGEKGELPAEGDTTKPGDQLIAGRSVIRLGHVSRPTLTIHRPAAGTTNRGTTVLVCPGGGYHILAMDLEGTEVCDWLNRQGITAALLKYRVPRRAGREKHAAALEDAQRAMALLRHRGPEWAIRPDRIGVLGFSAGAHLAAALSAAPARAYEAVDDADRVGTRPNFSVLVYPGYLTVPEQGDAVAPEVAVTSNTPPAFVVMTQDDPVRVENAVFYALALKRANVPVELHLYPVGGHGYGLRRTEAVVTTWPDRLADWLRSRGW